MKKVFILTTFVTISLALLFSLNRHEEQGVVLPVKKAKPIPDFVEVNDKVLDKEEYKARKKELAGKAEKGELEFNDREDWIKIAEQEVMRCNDGKLTNIPNGDFIAEINKIILNGC